MNSSEYHHINDELLSAYLDNAVTDQERDLVEAAVAADKNIAWRLETLTHTVRLLNGLPELAVPRSFALQESQVGDILAERKLHANRLAFPESPPVVGTTRLERFQQAWRSFWQAGNPMLRNAAVACLVLLLVLVGGDTFLQTSSLSGGQPQLAAETFSAVPAAAENGAVPVDAVAMVESDAAEAQEEPAEESAAAGEEVARFPAAMEAGDAAIGSTEPPAPMAEEERQDDSDVADDVVAAEAVVAATLAPLATPSSDVAAAPPADSSEPLYSGAGGEGEQAIARSSAALSSGPAETADSDAEGMAMPEPMAQPAQPAAESEQAAALELAPEADAAPMLAGTPPEAGPIEQAAEAVEDADTLAEITAPALAGAPPEAESLEESAAAVEEEVAAAPAAQTKAMAVPQAEQDVAPTVVSSAPIDVAPAIDTQEEVGRGLSSQSVLQIIQFALALLTVVLALLWWRSRTSLPTS